VTVVPPERPHSLTASPMFSNAHATTGRAYVNPATMAALGSRWTVVNGRTLVLCEATLWPRG